MTKLFKIITCLAIFGNISLMQAKLPFVGEDKETKTTKEDSKVDEVLNSQKPFTMVVGDNVIVVEKFKVVNQDSTTQATTANTEEKLLDETLKLSHREYSFAKLKNFYQTNKSELNSLFIGLAITFVLTILIASILKKITAALSKKINSPKKQKLLEQILSDIFGPLICVIIATGTYKSFHHVECLGLFSVFMEKLSIAVIAIAIIWTLFCAFDSIAKFLKKHNNYQNKHMQLLLIDITNTVTKTVIGTILILFILQNIFGFNINTLLASAGIAGLAFAFAAQNAIANFISSLMLIMDHPFNIGDRIKVGEVDGAIEAIGFRSTKIRALDGHVHYIPNNNMASLSIENVAQRKEIKDMFCINLTYDTTPEKMREAIKILHDILDDHPLFDMKKLPPFISFADMGDWALKINVIVWYKTQDFFIFQDAKSQINFEILERFNKAGLDFAFPSHTTYLAGDNKRPVNILKN